MRKRDAKSASGGQPVILRGDGLRELRHNLGTAIERILGYSGMMIEDAEDRGDGYPLGELRKIKEAAQHSLALVHAALAPALDQVTEAELGALHERLEVPVRAILDGAGALGAAGETTAVIGIRNAAEHLLAVSEGVFDASLPGPVPVERAVAAPDRRGTRRSISGGQGL
jgi:hypothetical protein